MVTKIGPVKDNAVISASGISVTAVKPLTMPTKLIEARPKNSRFRFILILGSPFRISTGADQYCQEITKEHHLDHRHECRRQADAYSHGGEQEQRKQHHQ